MSSEPQTYRLLQQVQEACKQGDWCRLESLLPQAQSLLQNQTPQAQDPSQAQQRDRLRAWLHYIHSGLALQSGDFKTAQTDVQASLKAQPAFAESWLLLAQIQSRQKAYSSALYSLLKAVDLRPAWLPAWQELVRTLQQVGDRETLLTLLADLLHPDWLKAPLRAKLSSSERQRFEAWQPALGALYLINAVASERFTPNQIWQQVQLWQRQFAPQPLPLKHLKQRAKAADPQRRLKLAYLSNEWSAAPVVLGYHGLFQAHSQDFELHALLDNSDVRQPELEALEAFAVLHPIWQQSLHEIGSLIQALEIDILIGLSGFFHPRGVQVLALKPCPITVYMGSNPPFDLQIPSLNLSGSDPVLLQSTVGPHPLPGQAFDPGPEFLSLPSFFRWQPPQQLQEALEQAQAKLFPISKPPQELWLGVIASPHKLTDPCLQLWAELLSQQHAVPLKLVFVNHLYTDPELCQRLRLRFQQVGGQAEKLLFLSPADNLSWYQELSRLDLILDSHPYGGALSSCDAFWLGVPVLSLSGGLEIGHAVLHALGLEAELLATDRADFLYRARDWIQNPTARKALSSQLRSCLLASPICDFEAHCRVLEQALHRHWEIWCGTQKSPL